MITSSIKQKIQSIVSVFETSSIHPNYAAIALAHDGPGGIQQVTYGKHQATEFANLRELISMYCKTKNAKYSIELNPYVSQIGVTPLAGDKQFISLLRSAALDPEMQRCQDKFFDKYYWSPALSFFKNEGFTLPFSMLVIYDSIIQSGSILKKLRNRFGERTPANGGNEKTWIAAYVHVRDRFLEFNPNPVVRASDYRTDCLIDCCEKENWYLKAPVVCKFNSSEPAHWITVA
jgi:chitosanase